MKSRKLKYDLVPLFFLVIFMIVSFACKVNYKEKKSLYEGRYNNKNENSLYRFLSYVSTENEIEETDLERIKKRGKLIALTGYGPTSYFVYKGTPMGFEHDLLKLLAKDLGVQLEIVTVKNLDQIIPMLNRGEGDIIADNLTVTKERDAYVDFTYPILKTKQVLVQRKPKNWEQMSYSTLEEHLLRSPIQLIGKSVHVRRGTAYFTRLLHLSEEIGGDIDIHEESGETETEELIAKVSEGKIPFTVSDENTALLHSKFYPNVDVQMAISFEQRISWAVREDSPKLLERVNQWIKKVKKQGDFYAIYNKYYKDRRGVAEMVKCNRSSMCGRKISSYDKLIIRHAENIGWDWRLLASLIYQESQFNPKAKSWAGACGLMQLMPGTAQCFGAVNPEDPIESLQAGTRYLKWLEKYWEKKVPDKNERLKFVIASYNVGQEHVADAQRLARKYKKDPHKWDDNVAYYLLQKSKDKYCNDPVVKYGYCRGSEPFAYVNNILERYEHYKKLIREAV